MGNEKNTATRTDILEHSFHFPSCFKLASGWPQIFLHYQRSSEDLFAKGQTGKLRQINRHVKSMYRLLSRLLFIQSDQLQLGDLEDLSVLRS